ncbi:NAD-dependent epimerase/dehydratase family protein [Streptomyces sp. YGL11-2]|uniref:NAD-dependent epimerase/dehydratase family protein n=1 Tax=Streptomyces sp. YGL11-2 TaxID=3414028 RepID=UPI003CEE7BA6
MRRTHAIVAGGAGFIGSHLCRRLLAEGYEVLCVDNLLTGRRQNIAALDSIGPFRFLVADVTTPVQLTGRADLVFHLASPASPADYLRHPLATLAAGAAGTHHTLQLAQQKSARYVLASTSEVYGSPQAHPQSEAYWGNVNPVGPRSVYDEAKRYAEALTTAFGRHTSTSIGIVRIFNTYGPRMRPDDGRAVPTFIRQALAGAPITVAGDGSQTRSLCYVDDIVSGILAMAASDRHEPVNLGNPHEITMLELAQEIRNLCGSTSPIGFGPRPIDDPQRRCPDITTARNELHWAPRVQLHDGLTRTIRAAEASDAPHIAAPP